jgi:hypothetical protein
MRRRGVVILPEDEVRGAGARWALPRARRSWPIGSGLWTLPVLAPQQRSVTVGICCASHASWRQRVEQYRASNRTSTPSVREMGRRAPQVLEVEVIPRPR